LTRALAAGLREANVSQDAIGYVETHGSGIPEEDRAEIQALANIFVEGKDASVALGALKSCLGYAGAAAGLAGFVKTALCLFHQIIPPLPRFEAPPDMPVLGGHVHVPIHPFFWPADRSDLPRRACLNALTVEGNAVSVVLEEYSPEGSRPIDLLQTAPAGIPEHGLFVIAGDTVDRLSEGLGHLVRHIEEKRRAGHSLGIAALDWFHRHRPDPAMPAALTLNLADYSACDRVFHEAHQALDQRKSVSFPGRSGCHFSPRPWGNSQRPAFIYPGSGSHYPGMGRQLSVQWPVIWRNANRRTERFAAQCRFPELMPYRLHWPHHWGQDAMKALNADPVTAIHGQVVFGCLATDLLGFMGVVPSAVIGYSLGETVGYFATGAWPDRGHMLERMERSDLFRTQLAGPCLAVRSHLPLAEDIPVNWRVAVVNRPAPVVRDALQDVPAVRLLVTNTPEECVIGGHGPAVEHLIHLLDCEAVYLEGVVAVHWEAVHAVSETYRDLHLFPTAPPSGIAYYSCAEGKRLALTSENAADSLLKQAIEGFDFPATIEQAYRDGARVFLEVGPQGSCTRMIRSILDDRPHLALTISSDPENEVAGLARALGILAAERLPVRLERYFPPQEAVSFSVPKDPTEHAHHSTTVYCGGVPLDPPHPPETVTSEKGRSLDADPDAEIDLTPVATNDFSSQAGHLFFEQTRALIRDLTNQTSATSDAHQRFLELTENLNRQYVQAVDLQTRLLDQARRKGLLVPETPVRRPPHPTPTKTAAPGQPETRAPHHQPPVVYDRKMCMEFAVGSIARVLGPEFAAVDRFPARVRLPDEPLMLVDRILCVEGKKGILGPGRIVTEHDVLPGAWYLDGDRAPVCISVEAGQADLFLSSYLGIDLEVKGERTYRLLDAAVTFHRGLPRPGDVIRYEIAIEKFIRQGPTWLFFFHFDGTIDGRPMITMRNGCAGFFTEQEVRHSGGIILTEEDTQPQRGILPENWHPPVPMVRESYNEAGLDALRRGDLGACFGPSFDGLRLPGGQHLPGGRMALIHRVLVLEPTGGRYGIGMIRAEADIRPDDWFLTCHFVDDMVMPGTLMYECCAHTLRIYLQRMGWVSGRTEAAYEPVIGRQAVLKCRGPVTPETRKVIYEVEISEIGFHPEPYAVADAHMYADGHRIVLFRGMTMQLTGMDQEALEEFWRQRRPARPTGGHNEASAVEEPPFSRERLIEFATGRPSKAFGAPYRPFDQERFIARLPAPPYAFIDRITRIDPPPWVLAPDGWVETECDVDSRAWYYRSNGAPFMPICILMEIALQACGFLAAYMGSALQSEKDLHFRNLDGEATLHTNIRSHAGPVHTRARLVQFSAAGDMLIEHYAFEVRQAETLVYEGRTSFGFFTPEALANQVGLPEADQPPALEVSKSTPVLLEDLPPLTPEDPQVRPFGNASSPSRALRMIDRIEYFDPQGGPQCLGHVRGSKTIDPDEWFFKAHFFHDPVWPGSLGIESLIQLLRFAAAALWPEQFHTHALELSAPAKHAWRYRGQVLPTHKRVEVDAIITDRRNHPSPMIRADGYLKCDGLSIYKMHNFGLLLTPRDNP
jgi:PfaB family protein